MQLRFGDNQTFFLQLSVLLKLFKFLYLLSKTYLFFKTLAGAAPATATAADTAVYWRD